MSVDGYMNISLEKTDEYVEGKLRHSYGEAFIRGNNGNCLFELRCAFFLTSCSAVYIRCMICCNLTFCPDMVRCYCLMPVEDLEEARQR